MKKSILFVLGLGLCGYIGVTAFSDSQTDQQKIDAKVTEMTDAYLSEQGATCEAGIQSEAAQLAYDSLMNIKPTKGMKVTRPTKPVVKTPTTTNNTPTPPAQTTNTQKDRGNATQTGDPAQQKDRGAATQKNDVQQQKTRGNATQQGGGH